MSKTNGDIKITRKTRAEVMGTLIGTRLQPDLLNQIDGWIADQGPPFMSRPEAIRRLVEKGLENG